MDTLKSHFSTSCPASSVYVMALMGQGDVKEKPQCTTKVHCGYIFAAAEDSPRTIEGTEKLKPTIKLKVDDGEIAVLPFIFCLF